jgi:hypothetical protein
MQACDYLPRFTLNVKRFRSIKTHPAPGFVVGLSTMLRDFDIFENYPDGSTIWRTCVSGKFEAERKLQELAEQSENEFWAISFECHELLPTILGRHRSRTSAAKAAS